MSALTERFENVTLKLKANVYFDGGVVSHSFEAGDGMKRSVGTVRPGTYHFNTGAPERMDILAGTCAVKLDGSSDWKPYAAGSGFDVPAKSGFDIRVDSGLTEYLCSYK